MLAVASGIRLWKKVLDEDNSELRDATRGNSVANHSKENTL